MDSVRLVTYDKIYFVLSKTWLLDSEVNYLIHAGDIPNDEERLQWFNSLMSRSDYLIWGVEYNGTPVGVCGLKKIDGKTAEYWGYIGEKSYWGKGIGKMMMAIILDISKELKLSSIWLRVRKYNHRAIGLYKSIGFIVDLDEPETFRMIKAI